MKVSAYGLLPRWNSSGKTCRKEMDVTALATHTRPPPPTRSHAAIQVQEKRLETAREEEKMLEAQRQLEEEQGPGADKDAVMASKKAVGTINNDQVRIRVWFWSWRSIGLGFGLG